MGQCDTALRVVVVDPDETFRAELGALIHVGIEVVFVEPPALADITMQWTNRDVVVVCVGTPKALALVAALCGHPLAPPVIAVGGAGFEGKSLEHILLLAEVRGAVATLLKPIAAPDFVLSATLARKNFSAREPREINAGQNQVGAN